MMWEVTPTSSRALDGYAAGGITGLEYIYTAGIDAEARSSRRHVLLDNQLAEYGENLHLHRPRRGDIYRQAAHGHLNITLVRRGHGRPHHSARAGRYGYGRNRPATCEYGHSHYYGIFDCLQLHAPKLQKKRQSASLSADKIGAFASKKPPCFRCRRFSAADASPIPMLRCINLRRFTVADADGTKQGRCRPLGCIAPVYGIWPPLRACGLYVSKISVPP